MKVTLPAGIKSISGAIKQSDGSKLVFKTFTRPSVNRKKGETETRAYLIPKRERATPPSMRELAVRQRFVNASLYFQTLTNFQREMYAKAWKRDKYMFNGKKYATLRGYIVAHYCAGHPVDEMLNPQTKGKQGASRGKARGN